MVLGIVGISLLTSCEKDVVELSPVDRLSDETSYETVNRCELAVVGVYDAAQSGYYKGNDARRGYPFGSGSILQSEMRGEDMVNVASFFLITYRANHTPTSANNVSMWENSLAAINRANVVKAGIENAKDKGILTDQNAINQYIGECLFIRALTYSNMLVHFCLPYGVTGNNNYGLPYYEQASNTPESMAANLLIKRSSVEDTYTKILADLSAAEGLLPDKNSKNGITRASKGAAIALKARLYLWMKDWPSVITESQKIVEGTTDFSSPVGGYKLADNPATPFVSFQSNNESIFSIENSADDNSTVNGSIGQMMSARVGGRSLVRLSPIIYNSKFWLENDLRKKELTYKSGNQVYADKYKRPTEQDEYAPIIRYADVLLTYAEALVRSNGNITLALELLNAVRNRSVEAADYYTAATFPTNNDLLEAILWERRIELFAEGRRWEDIHRLINDPIFDSKGIPAKINPNKVNAAVYGVNIPIDADMYLTSLIKYTDKRFLWPISQDDIIRNPTLAEQQNEGW